MKRLVLGVLVAGLLAIGAMVFTNVVSADESGGDDLVQTCKGILCGTNPADVGGGE